MIWLALAACARSPRALDLRDPRISDAQRSWLVDAQDEVAIARARIDDAERGQQAHREHHDALMVRIRAAGVEPSAWQALGRARRALAEREHRRAVARLEHAEARLRLVRAEVAVAADLGVHDVEPLRTDVARRRDRLTEAVRAVEQARAEAEDRADEAWAGWQQHLATTDGIGAFWLDVTRDATADAAP